jgi:hypothetical protein
VYYTEENSLSLFPPALNPDLTNYPGSQRKLEPGIHHASFHRKKLMQQLLSKMYMNALS